MVGLGVVGLLDEVQRCVTPEGIVVEKPPEGWLMTKDLGPV